MNFMRRDILSVLDLPEDERQALSEMSDVEFDQWLLRKKGELDSTKRSRCQMEMVDILNN